MKAITERELELRRLELEDAEGHAALETRGLLQRCLRALELSLVLASFQEAVTRLGLSTVAEVAQGVERIDTFVYNVSRLDPRRVLDESRDVLAPLAAVVPAADAPASVDMALVVRSVQSFLLHCPIAAIERAGHAQALAELAHRCRVVYDDLRAFVARNSHPDGPAIHVAGSAYADGRLSVDEVAAVLGFHVSDAVALLEEHGFRRSVDKLRLTDEERTDRLRAIRAERLARDGRPSADPELVGRDVIASQRIEDVDARSWIRT